MSPISVYIDIHSYIYIQRTITITINPNAIIIIQMITMTPNKRDKALNLARLPIPPLARGRRKVHERPRTCRPVGRVACRRCAQ